MKREILCQNCSKVWKQTYAQDQCPYPGEHVKSVDGRVRMNCVCDYCGRPIRALETVTATSLWSDRSPAPYVAWESDYLIPETEQEKGEKQA